MTAAISAIKRRIKLTNEEKYTKLKNYIRTFGRAAVAFSGGTDSALLAYAAAEALGCDAFAMTLWSPLLAPKDKCDIFEFTERFNISLIRVPIDETESEDFVRNCSERCYICKSARIKAMVRRAEIWNIPWILDGSNVDDISDFRPGMRALKECKSVISPLLECGLTKKEIREMSAMIGIPTAYKPASACLASRIPTGVPIDKPKITSVAVGEEIIRQYLPDTAQVRMRYDGLSARIETDLCHIPVIEQILPKITGELKDIGVKNISVDRGGYKMGGVTQRAQKADI